MSVTSTQKEFEVVNEGKFDFTKGELVWKYMNEPYHRYASDKTETAFKVFCGAKIHEKFTEHPPTLAQVTPEMTMDLDGLVKPRVWLHKNADGKSYSVRLVGADGQMCPIENNTNFTAANQVSKKLVSVTGFAMVETESRNFEYIVQVDPLK